jgi:hypothetical protein
MGYLNREKQYGETNSIFLRMMYEKYLLRLSKSLPSSFMDKNGWPQCSKPLETISNVLRDLHYKNMVRKYCKKLAPEKKKMVIETLF